MLEALVFDVDGTVAETEDLHRRAFNLAFDLHEVELSWDEAEYRRMLRVHGGKERIVKALAEVGAYRPAREIAAIHASKTRFYAMQLSSGLMRWRPGVRRLMDEARQAGLRLALATTTTLENLEPLFSHVMGAGWRGGFDAIVAGDMVRRKKPAPDAYVEVLRRLEVDAARAVAFEDSAAGVRSARAAGLAVVATPSAWLEGDDLAEADLVLDHLGDPTQPWAERHPRLCTRWLSAAALVAWHDHRETACNPHA